MTPKPFRLSVALLALAVVLTLLAVARPLASSAGAAREMGRARAASDLLFRLRDRLSSLPPPAPRCAAACFAGDAVVPPAARAEVMRLAEAMAGPGAAGLEGLPIRRLGEQLRAGLGEPAWLDPAVGDGSRLEAQSLLTALEDDQQARAQRAAATLWSSLPAALGGGVAVGIAGLALGMVALGAALRQVARRRRAEEGKATLLRVIEQVGDLVTILDGKGRIEYVNKAVEEATGWSRGELVGARNASWLPWYAGVPFLPDMQGALLAGRPYQAGVLGRRKTGEAFLTEETATPLSGRGGELRGIVSTAREVTEHRMLECILDYRAKHDSLTGLPNRRHLIRLLDQALGSAEGVRRAAVLAVDLDRFTQLNVGLGSAAGDRILVEAAERLAALAGPRDIVARLGGDAFALVRVGGDGPVDVGGVGEAIHDALSGIRTGEHDLPVTVSTGIALFPEHGRDARVLLDRADLALGAARPRGRGAVQVYDERVASDAADLFHMERRLSAALRDHEYLVRYQPYFDLDTRSLEGVEALVGWRNSDLGTVPASRFVPLLEDTGMIVEVGQWVLETACRQAREWQAQGRGLPVSVNLSGAQFRHSKLVEMVADTVGRHRLAPGVLSLEVTESVCLEDLGFAASTLQKLKDLGVSISVDDFGTGYSSLGYLRRLPLDTIKIDISFVRDVSRDQDAASIVSAITTLARSLNLGTIAEGVETEEQRKVLHLLRCDMGQGFYFSPAVAPAEVEGFWGHGRPPARA